MRYPIVWYREVACGIATSPDFLPPLPPVMLRTCSWLDWSNTHAKHTQGRAPGRFKMNTKCPPADSLTHCLTA